jgi:Tol biopolymer transport system component/predicted Ser/Thr protein kinase
VIGKTFSHYKVLEEISRGGMGIVYRALDMKLDRAVALKVLPPDLVSDHSRRGRFVQEAKAAAALSHPHIATVFDVDEAGGAWFIAMELIEGEKLSELLSRERLPLSRALEFATEVAEGLSRAHEKGIVHRDLKPANLMVTRDGHIKIIDFGLAKLVEPLRGGTAESEAQTGVKGHTHPGQVMGTVSYMSPEQARGRDVDSRSDIFTFGVVLYEMVTGTLAFPGESAADTLSAILSKPAPPLPPLSGDAVTQAALARVLEKCLAKDPDERYQATKDLALDLKWLSRGSGSGVSTPPAKAPERARPMYRLVAAVLFGLVALAGIFYLIRPRDTPVQRLANAVQVTAALGLEIGPSWSPEAGRLAYWSDQSGNGDIWVSQIGGGEPLNLTADHKGFDGSPSWSPDGQQIAFWSRRDGGGYFVMSALGGPPRKVSSRPRARSRPQWSRDGAKLAGIGVENEEIFAEIVSLETGETKRISLPGRELSRMDLAWSPDERFFAYVDAKNSSAQVTQLRVLRLEDGESFETTDGRTNDWSPSWSSDGRALYFVSNRGGAMDLWRQALGNDGSPEGAPEPVTSGIGMRDAAFSPDGRKLAYSRGRTVGNLWKVPILEDRPATWADAQQLTFEQAYIESFDLSPDGKRLAVSSDRSGNPDLWTMPAEGGPMQRLTTDPTPDWEPKWSHDGSEIAFYAYRSGNREIWVMPAGGGAARQLTRGQAENVNPDWSPDGKEIAFSSARGGNPDIWVVPASGGEPRQIATGIGADFFPQWSPDGESLVFSSVRGREDRLWRVAVTGGEPEPMTKREASIHCWSPDGKRLFYPSGNLWELAIEDGAERQLSDFSGRPGFLVWGSLATDGRDLFFGWSEDLGDIWVVDVEKEN